MNRRILVLEGLDDTGRCEVHRKPDGELRLVSNVNAGITEVVESCGEAMRVLLGVRGSTDVHIPQSELIVNTVSDPDAARVSLLQVHEAIAHFDVPVINRPAGVIKTRRDQLPALMQAHPHLYAPPVQRIEPRRLDDIAGPWRAGELPSDFLIRPAGTSSHGGTGLYRVSTDSDLDKLERYAFDGRYFLVAPFVDYAAPDGLYWKYRLVLIDGQIYPRHAIAATDWMIHSESRHELMLADTALQQREQRFLADPARVLGDDVWADLQAFAAAAPLEYGGIDLGLQPDGRAVIFEFNASMNALGSGAGQGVDYLEPAVAAIRAAVGAMIERRLD